jgi:uncharacterized Zn-binding protein involved in type VI secretion
MPGMAATIGSLTAHGGTVTGPGCPTILINGKPAACIGDMHVCPMVTPGAPPIPHVGGPITGPGVPTVLFCGRPAATLGDLCVCVGCPSSIIMGSPNVFIGTGGGGGGGGSKASSEHDNIISGLKSGEIHPVQGSESFPIAVQAAIVQAAKHYSEAQVSAIVEMHKEKLEKKTLTIADIVEILKLIEKEDGFEAARFFVWHLDYCAINRLAEAFINGEDTNPKNDPNQMPTRFMVLYGADDDKLRTIDDHPEKAEKEEHKMTVANIRKAMNLMGYEVKETGPFDDELQNAFWSYLGRGDDAETDRAETHIVKEYEHLGTIAKRYELSGWNHLYEINKKTIGENPDLVKPETELKIPEWKSKKGDEKIKAKGVKVIDWVGGTCYKYPWVKFSYTMMTKDNNVYAELDSTGNKRADFEKKKKFELRHKETQRIIASGEIGQADEIEMLVPDCLDAALFIDEIQHEI